MPAGGTRLPIDAQVIEKRLHTFSMDGPKVWDFADGHGAADDPGAARRTRHGARDVDLLVLHQSNLRMIEAMMTALEVPQERTVTTVETYGNTAAASIPLTLEKAWRTGRLHEGSRVVLCGFGGGLSWGAALLNW